MSATGFSGGGWWGRVGLDRFLAHAHKQPTPPHLFPPSPLTPANRALADPYPEAKREACTAIGHAARHAPVQLRLHQASLLKPLLGNLRHQHARVRVLALQVCKWHWVQESVPTFSSVYLSPLTLPRLDQ